jgi:hypothetical protein
MTSWTRPLQQSRSAKCCSLLLGLLLGLLLVLLLGCTVCGATTPRLLAVM